MTTTPQAPEKKGTPGEQGFALLMVLFMSAAIAISLAISLPRTAMQAQRVREERLIYRGEQYKRAVQLYFRSQKRYPASIDDLEETNGIRFLRRRYQDPITGEDEWRLIHMGASGRFTDSLVYDTEDEDKQASAAVGIGGSQPSAPIGSVAAQAIPEGFQAADGRFRGADRARAVRQSEAPAIPGQPVPGAGGMPEGSPEASAQPYDPNSPYAAAPGGAPGNPEGQAGQPQPGQYPGYSRMRPSQIPAAAQQRGGPVPFGQAGQRPGQPVRGQTGIGQMGVNRPGANVGPGAAQGRPSPISPGGRPAAFGAQGVGGQAASIIQSLLTSPRPGGLAGLRAAQQGATQQAAFTGGIAGVATKAEDRGVKVYGGYEEYNYWEFVYDYRQEGNLGGPPGGSPGQVGDPMAQGQPGLTSSGVLSAPPAGVPAGQGQAPTDPVGNAYPPGYPAGAAGVPPPGQQSPAGPYAQPGMPLPSDPAAGGPAGTDPFPGAAGQDPNAPNAPGAAGEDPANPAVPQPGQPGYVPYDPNAPPGSNNPNYNAPQPGVPGMIPGFPGARPPQTRTPGQRSRPARPNQPYVPFFPPGVFPGQPGTQAPQNNNQQR